jgi:hypothetical protein
MALEHVEGLVHPLAKDRVPDHALGAGTTMELGDRRRSGVENLRNGDTCHEELLGVDARNDALDEVGVSLELADTKQFGDERAPAVESSVCGKAVQHECLVAEGARRAC